MLCAKYLQLPLHQWIFNTLNIELTIKNKITATYYEKCTSYRLLLLHEPLENWLNPDGMLIYTNDTSNIELMIKNKITASKSI